MRTMRWAAGLTLITLMGCGGTTHKVEDIDDPGMVDADVVGTYEVTQAAESMSRKIAGQASWPEWVKLSDMGKPQVRIGKISNRTTVKFDVVYLQNELNNVMQEQGAVWITGRGDSNELAEVHDERDYSASGMTEETMEDGQEAVTGLVLVGEIVESSIDQKNRAQRDYIFYLKLMDTRKARVILMSKKGIRKVKERNLFGG